MGFFTRATGAADGAKLVSSSSAPTKRSSKWDVQQGYDVLPVTVSAAATAAPPVVVSDLASAFAAVAPVLARARFVALAVAWGSAVSCALAAGAVVVPWYSVTYPEPRGFTGSFNGGVQFYSPQTAYYGLYAVTVCPGIFATTRCVASAYTSIFTALTLDPLLVPQSLQALLRDAGNSLAFALFLLIVAFFLSAAATASGAMSAHAMLRAAALQPPAGLRVSLAYKGLGTAYAATALAATAWVTGALGSFIAFGTFGPGVVGSDTNGAAASVIAGELLAGSMLVFQAFALAAAITLKLGLRGSARFAPPESKAVLYDFAGNGHDTSCCC